ncbi:MAG TPA: SUMF1/EgtB/PvdO family nonheme iron enzyme [Thermoanaerobaculia bacterium]
MEILRPERFGRPRAGRHVEVEELDPDTAARFGRKLFQAVFVGRVRTLFLLSRARAADRKEGLRIRLMLSDDPRLSALPWEYLQDTDTGQPLALSVETPIVRYLDLPIPPPALPVKPPLRVLLVSANPSDACKLDLGRECLHLTQALAGLEGQWRVVVEHLESATLAKLADKLDEQPFQVLHFMGHGDFRREEEKGYLVLEDDQGCSDPVPGHRLATLFHNHKALRLVVLNACEGAKASQADAFGGVAQSLVQRGIPAVVAMQLQLSDEVAITFSRRFYQALVEDDPVDLALTKARLAIFTGYHSTEWGTPVLHMRSPDGRIFSPESPAPAEGSPIRPGNRARFWPAAVAVLFLVSLATFLSLRVRPESEEPKEPPSSRPVPPVISSPDCPSPPGLSMPFAKVVPRTFLMGSEKGEKDERPTHEVTIRQPFCLGAFEVTQEQWKAIMGADNNPSPFKGDRLPVQKVSWEDIQEALRRLNAREPGARYRLPTEAEWEYAARAGSQTRYSFGDNPAELWRYGNCSSKGHNDGFDGPAPVGSFRPNSWGLFDMHGNVWEWVEDWYGPYGSRVVKDRRVRRGGSFRSSPESCRSARRSSWKPGSRSQENGFRLVRDLKGTEAGRPASTAP